MSELDKCPQCDSPVSRKVDGEVHFCCDSWITSFGAFIAKDFCNGRTQAIAETEARIYLDIIDMIEGLHKDVDFEGFTKYDGLGVENLLRRYKNLLSTSPKPQSDSVNDGSNIGNSDISIGSTPTNVQKEGIE